MQLFFFGFLFFFLFFFCIKNGLLHLEMCKIHLNMIDSIVNEKYFNEINEKISNFG